MKKIPRNEKTKNRRASKPLPDDDKSGHPPKITVPWGRSASEHRPGLFIKHYFEKHGDACAADIYRSLSDEIERINKERVEIGEKSLRRPNYSSFSRYFHWFLILKLIERTGKVEASIYPFLVKRIFYRLTDKGKIEINAWKDPIMVVHPEFR